VNKHSLHALAEQTANIGTPVYMAPELITDTRIGGYDGAKVDVFSFGVMMWAIFARKKPYEMIAIQKGLNLWTLRDLVIDGMRPDIDDAGELDSAPTRAVKLMEQCWAAGASFRPSGFDEIRSRLEKVLESMDRPARARRSPHGSDGMLSAAKVTNMMRANRNKGRRGGNRRPREKGKGEVRAAAARLSLNPMHEVLQSSKAL
jgi:serine/threonine protein kinase